MSISGRKKKFKKIKTYEEVGTTFKLKTEETNYLGTNVTADITKDVIYCIFKYFDLVRLNFCTFSIPRHEQHYFIFL